MTKLAELRRFLAELPKAELHVHLEGTVDGPTLDELARRNRVDLAAPTLLRYSEDKQFEIPPPRAPLLPFSGSFFEFIQRYVKISSAIQRAEDFVLLIDRYAAAAKAEGVVAAEIYVSPTTLLRLNLNEEELFSGMLAAERHAHQQHGVHIGWIFDIVRNSPVAGSETIELALTARARGVTLQSIGLAGLEQGHPAPPFEEDFRIAAGHGFTLLAHAGETAGHESVSETIRTLKPKRIGHGVRAIESPQLVNQLRDSQIPLEVCPWSNVLLGVYSEQEHPIRALLDAGVSMVIASDDPGIFGKSLLDNYLFAAARGVSREELATLAAASLTLRHR